ncbi:hypothetical protein [Sinimarinibacterium sp. NLF-5-8]|uniref:hypothetical protein n=1 Tax=Sinimarinibacterium sp. NLF-5-8 TaxID=2698684 RepID=UPI00137BAE1E|nr:hypothetical protein [Sinimarinibacterium sp. NLF-5-8]QHS10536.1 hypothetical protein GT972_10610 [Sinimarinibacterium sp. NLF-5-8]
MLATDFHVRVIGAVAVPGEVSVQITRPTLEYTLSQVRPDATADRFAVMAIRPRVTGREGLCVPVVDRHAALLLAGDAQTDPMVAEQLQGLLDGRLRRVPMSPVAWGRPRQDQPSAPLAASDVIVVPHYGHAVFVARGNGEIVLLAHHPGLMADDYLTQAHVASAVADGYVLHYPDTSVVKPARAASWRSPPRAVPPGALLTPDVDCLQVLP